MVPVQGIRDTAARGTGIFPKYQPVYDEHGVATFPVNLDENEKRPAIQGWMRTGRRGSRELARKRSFADSNALGIAVKPNNLTILDVDTSDERVLVDAMDKHGESPLIVRTKSGGWHAYYQNNGETRNIRAWDNPPIDVLGNGYVVAPPSQANQSQYRIVQGSLDDLHDLPTLQNLPETATSPALPSTQSETVKEGRRNDDLFRSALRMAHECDSEAELLEKARAHVARNHQPPLADDEIRQVVAQAWRKTVEGMNFKRKPYTPMTHDEIDELEDAAPDALRLLLKLRRHNWGGCSFRIANAMADKGTVKLSRKRLAAARKYLINRGFVVEVRPPSSEYGPALYTWPC